MSFSAESIDPYIRTIFLRNGLDFVEFPSGYVRRSAFEAAMMVGLVTAIEPYGSFSDRGYLIGQIFDDLHSSGVITQDGDDLAGSYFKFSAAKLDKYRNAKLEVDEIARRSSCIGDQYLTDVFRAYADGNAADASFIDSRVPVPASDRIVNLNHNQVALLESPLDNLIVELGQDNGIPESPGVRERILGQLKAGRELILSGSFRAHLLYWTLVQGLLELANRYKDHVIGAAAGKLVELLIEHIFGIKK